MAKPRPHTPVAAETKRRRTDPDYFIDIIGRSGFQGGYCWMCQQPDGTWKVWRRSFVKPQIASHKPQTRERRSANREIARVLVPSGYLMQWVDTFRLCEGHHLRIASVIKPRRPDRLG